MSCPKCKETDCIASGVMTLSNGIKVFADLRFDVENAQLDMEFGTLDEDNIGAEIEWSNAADIRFCPFCGAELEISPY